MINRTPEVGKYLVTETIFTYGLAGMDFGRITKISKNRIYCTDDRDGREFYVMKFSAICDDLEEVKYLQTLSKYCIKEINNVWVKNKTNFNSLFTL